MRAFAAELRRWGSGGLLLGLLALASVVAIPGTAWPCSPPLYPATNPPEEDLGVVPGESPSPPVVEDILRSDCSNAISECCFPRVEIRYSGTSAEIFEIERDGDVRFFRPASAGRLLLDGSYVGRVEVVAWREIGYRSNPVIVVLPEPETQSPDPEPPDTGSPETGSSETGSDDGGSQSPGSGGGCRSTRGPRLVILWPTLLAFALLRRRPRR